MAGYMHILQNDCHNISITSHSYNFTFIMMRTLKIYSLSNSKYIIQYC